MNVTGAILAGGHATRFQGRDKGSVVVGGRSILERQIGELSQIATEILVVGSRLPAAGHHATPIHFVADRVTGAGPLGGLDAALAAAAHEHVVLLACDMPFVSAQLLAYLTSLAGEADIVVPRTERGYHPLCAVYGRRCAQTVAVQLAARNFAMKNLFGELRVRVVEGPELAGFGDPDRVLANVNTPADLGQLEALAGHQH